MAQKANVTCLVLTHFGPGEVDEKATSAVIRETYKGEIIYAIDLMQVTAGR